MKKKKIEKKRFYPVRQYRLSDENADWLLKIKKGTWNHTFDQLRKKDDLHIKKKK